MANLPETTRRGIIGAMAALPLLGAVAMPAHASAGRSAWQAALDQHAAAWNRLNEHPVHDMLLDHPDYPAATADESVCVQACMETEAAIQAMPAPDYRAVIEKLELHVRNYGEDSEGFVEAAIADLKRLAAEGR